MKVFLLLNLTFALITLMTLSGCINLYNDNGWSIWGKSKTDIDSEIHMGFIGTDLYFMNGDNEALTTDEKINQEIWLQDDTSYGTLGIYGKKRF